MKPYARNGREAVEAAGARIALVIGNGRYRNASTLDNPASDAASMAATLAVLDFDVISGIDLIVLDMDRKLSEPLVSFTLGPH